jgi:HK97 family phage major capsid protein
MTHHISVPKARGLLSVRAEGGPNVGALVAEMSAAFESFKKENDAEIAALKKGQADVVQSEKVDRINSDITAIQKMLDDALKAETTERTALQARLDEIEAGVKRPALGAGADQVRDFRAEAAMFLAGMSGQTDVPVSDDQVRAYEEYTKVYAAQFLKRGDKKADVQAAMEVGSDPDGGYWVPTQQVDMIKKRLFETSAMRSVATSMTITTDSVGFPTDTDDAVSGGWVGETEGRDDTDTPKVGEQVIYVREQYAQPKVTQKLLDMATINVEAWLNGKIADKLSRVENTAFVTGNGVAKPRGFLDYATTAVATSDADGRAWGKLQYRLSGAAGAYPALSGGGSNPDALIDLVADLKPAYRANANWAMSRATEAEHRKLKDNDGNYLIGRLDEQATGFNMLGFQIVTMEDMPALAGDSFSLALGDFREGYLILDGRGIRILRDPYTSKPYVKFYTTKWTGGDVVNFDAIKLMKFATS